MSISSFSTLEGITYLPKYSFKSVNDYYKNLIDLNLVISNKTIFMQIGKTVKV